MSEVDITLLRIKIYQPQAHYRIPFTYQRRHTYPIPPYSTVLGLIANVLGIRNVPNQEEPCIKENCSCNYHKLKKVKISICGNFKSKTTEHIWLRNLSKEAHEGRFGYSENRYVSGHIEHIGGQIPCLIDILNDVTLFIYLYHEDIDFLNHIKSSFENIKQERLSPLHLGRAEDWIVIDELKFPEKDKIIIKEINGYFDNFFWIPERIFNMGFNFDFSEVNGLIYNLTTFYKIVNGARNFSYIRAKLNDGNIGDLQALYDCQEDIPIFLADLGGGE